MTEKKAIVQTKNKSNAGIVIDPNKYRELFKCALSQDVLKSPITFMASGLTYSRSWLMKYFKQFTGTVFEDPQTRQVLRKNKYYKDENLKDIIKIFTKHFKTGKNSANLTLKELRSIKSLIEKRQQLVKEEKCVFGFVFKSFVEKLKTDVAEQKESLPSDITEFFSKLNLESLEPLKPEAKATTAAVRNSLSRRGATLVYTAHLQQGFWRTKFKKSFGCNDNKPFYDGKFWLCSVFVLPLIPYYLVHKYKRGPLYNRNRLHNVGALAPLQMYFL